MIKFLKQKNKGFTQLVDFDDAISSRTKSASSKFTTGFTLVETLIAISIFSMSILAMMTILASGVADTNYAKRKMTATYLAQEGIERIRNIRDNYVINENKDWGMFNNDIVPCIVTNHNSGCYFKDDNTLIECTSDICQLLYSPTTGNYFYNIPNLFGNTTLGENTGFTRTIRVKTSDDDGVLFNGGEEIKIESIVSWTQGSGEKSVSFSENLFNWYEI